MIRPIGAVFSAVALLFVVGNARGDEATARKAVEDAGGKFVVDDAQDGKPVVGIILFGPSFKVEILKEMKEFKHLEKLRIGGPWVTDAGLQELKKMKNLKILQVRGPRVSDGGIKDLQEALPNIKITRANTSRDFE